MNQRRRRSFLMLYLHVHHLFLIFGGIMMGIGGIAVGIEHWKSDISEGRRPLADPYVQAAATLIGFAVFAVTIIFIVIYRGVRSGLRELEQQRRLFPMEKNQPPD